MVRNLEGMLFRVKLIGPSQQTETDEFKNVETGSWNMQLCAIVFFIDECGYNIWTARSHGRARQGERAYSMRLARTERDRGPSSIAC